MDKIGVRISYWQQQKKAATVLANEAAKLVEQNVKDTSAQENLKFYMAQIEIAKTILIELYELMDNIQ